MLLKMVSAQAAVNVATLLLDVIVRTTSPLAPEVECVASAFFVTSVTCVSGGL